MAKIALITGSTSGIGLVMARQFAASGYIVALNSFLDEEQATNIIENVKSVAKREVAYFKADLALEDRGSELVETVIEKFGQIDILINNAGVQKVAPIEQFTTKDWQQVRAISLDSAFFTMRAAIKDMKKRSFGRIINISSAHGLVASPFKSAYIAAKHGLIGLSKTVALEVAENGITVNAICPGYVQTPLVEKQLADQAKVYNISIDEVAQKIMLDNQPNKKFIQPEEVASLALYLCSDMAKSITGAAIAIDGGWTAK